MFQLTPARHPEELRRSDEGSGCKGGHSLHTPHLLLNKLHLMRVEGIFCVKLAVGVCNWGGPVDVGLWGEVLQGDFCLSCARVILRNFETLCQISTLALMVAIK